MQIKQAEETAKDDINEIKAELAEKVKPLQEEIKLKVRSLEAFAALHKNDFGKKRSRKLNFGILGWRKSTSISIKKNTLELIKQVFTNAKQKMCIRVKESVDKEALAKLTEEQLASVGARRKEKDVFFVEPSSQEAVDYVE
jgi:phage host-nuclease inhibitor protein Gam